ncbi:hypothetical protein PUN28_010802 [Cardiocondyla obscurior]|uniref:Uncharacterized protein n=1 Tax=Cardiocondyla obscurior TaxID=286306 RepID=A0AAW2FHT6_9HYME
MKSFLYVHSPSGMMFVVATVASLRDLGVMCVESHTKHVRTCVAEHRSQKSEEERGLLHLPALGGRERGKSRTPAAVVANAISTFHCTLYLFLLYFAIKYCKKCFDCNIIIRNKYLIDTYDKLSQISSLLYYAHRANNVLIMYHEIIKIQHFRFMLNFNLPLLWTCISCSVLLGSNKFRIINITIIITIIHADMLSNVSNKKKFCYYSVKLSSKFIALKVDVCQMLE